MPLEAKYRGGSRTSPLAEKLPSYNSNGISPKPFMLRVEEWATCVAWIRPYLSLIRHTAGPSDDELENK